MRTALLLSVLVGLAATAAHAEGFDLSQTPAGLAASLPGGWKPEVGGWVMYKVNAPNLDAPKLYRMACTGTEKVGEQGLGYWLEMADAEPGRGSVLTRMLLVGDLRDRASVKRLMIWAPPQPPFEIPASELPTSGVSSDSCTSDRDVGQVCGGEKKQALGTRKINTAAGSFKSRGFKVRKPGGTQVEQWVSDSVPLIGLVRMTSTEGVSWELVGTGRDAKNSFPDDSALLDVAGMRKMAKELEKTRSAIQPADLRDEAHGGTDPLEGSDTPLPP